MRTTSPRAEFAKPMAVNRASEIKWSVTSAVRWRRYACYLRFRRHGNQIATMLSERQSEVPEMRGNSRPRG
jgi:hypothetical protein